jgi:hypothetical protein
MWKREARVSWLSLKAKFDSLSVVWPQNHWDDALKPVLTVSSGLASKTVVMVSPGLASKRTVGFLVESQNQGGGGFFGLGIKTCSSGLVILTSKSLRRFLGLGLKTKQALICRLRHKTDRERSIWDTHRDLAACFTWKQVWLGFPVWPED